MGNVTRRYENPEETVTQILSNLTSSPTRMSASGVGGKELQLDFAQQTINSVPLNLSLWPIALESVLPKVTLTSLEVQLPSQPGPVPLLISEVTVDQLRSLVSIAHVTITQLTISSCPENPKLQFICRLLDLCASVTHLNITLTNDKLDWTLLKYILCSKRLVELSINLSHLTDNYVSEHLAQLCRVLAPGTLKSLTLTAGLQDTKDFTCPPWQDAEGLDDHPYIFLFEEFCAALQNKACSFPALQCLTIGTRHFRPRTTNWISYVSSRLYHIFTYGHIGSVINDAFPELRTLEFIMPTCMRADFVALQGVYTIYQSYMTQNDSLPPSSSATEPTTELGNVLF